ncbi:MAG: transposase [Leptospirales bacterium]
MTNATSEGLNFVIQTIKKSAYGFRNKEIFKVFILLFLWNGGSIEIDTRKIDTRKKS